MRASPAMGRLGVSELLIVLIVFGLFCGGAVGIFVLGYFLGKRAGQREAQQLPPQR